MNGSTRKPLGLSVYSREHARSSPDVPNRSVGVGECAWPGCSFRETDRYPGNPVPLCVEHAIRVWQLVGDDMAYSYADQEARAAEATSGRSPDHGHIYYLLIDGHVKIGHSKHVERRVRQYPPTAHLICVHSGSRADELNIHHMLTTSRESGREWYRRTPEVLELLDRVVSEHGEPDRASFRKEWGKPSLPAPRGRGSGFWRDK